jgi:tetraacyldisaccharide 4'-kinase
MQQKFIKIFRVLLSPLTFLYAVIINWRNGLFDHGIFRVTKVNAFIISVGNLTVGGSGKTPAVILIAKILKSYNKSVGILSRGYSRISRGYLFVSDGTKLKATVDESSDEMFFVSTETNFPTAVSERRVDGAKKLIKQSNAKILLLDDAFQHRWIHRDIDIVMIEQKFLNKVSSIEQKMLPLGSMREPFESLNRADVIIINRKFSDTTKIPEKLAHFFKGKTIFTGFYEATGIFDVKSANQFSVEEFRGQKSLVVCGIARPYSFLNVLEKNNIDIKNKMILPDHKKYSLNEIQTIRKKFYDCNANSVLTTQKDAVKLIKFSKDLDDIDIFYLKIELKIDNADSFAKLLLNKINTN